MIYLTYSCQPTRSHPEYDRIGEAFVNCWIRVRSFAEAKKIAERDIRSQRWRILSLEDIWKIQPGDFQHGDKSYSHYEQARTDREVYLFHQSPRYPVYTVDFEAVALKSNAQFPPGTTAEVRYWVVNSKVSKTADHFDAFWDKDAHVRKAVALGRKEIREENWKVTSVTTSRPVNRRSFARSPKLTQYYEEAEEYGSCLLFQVDA